MNALFRFSNIPILFFLCGLIYFPFLGEVNLFDWDETMIASISKEMFNKSEILQPWLNGKFYLEFPPFFFWCQLISFKYLGINEYAARFPNAICALLVVLTLYNNGKRIYSSNFGMLWAIIYISMILPQIYHKSGLLDPWFSFFIYLSIYNMARVIEMRQESNENFYRKRELFSNLFYSAFAMAGAVLTKGIEGYFIILLTYWFVFFLSSAKYGFGYGNIVRWTFYLICILSIWVLVEYKWHGEEYLTKFFDFQIKELDFQKSSWTDRICFPWIILFLGCFPASALMFNQVKVNSYESTIQKVFRLMMVSCLIVVFIIITFVKTKLAHFTVLAYFPISYLAAYNIRYIFEEKLSIKSISIFLIFLGGIIWTSLLILVPVTRAKLDFLEKYIHEDTLLQGLAMQYPWKSMEIGIGIFYLLIFIITIVFIFKNKNQLALIILFFGTMIMSEIILVYYFPKIEQITQGAQIDFVKHNQDENTYFHYVNGNSFIPNFYTNQTKIITNFSLDSLKIYKKRDFKNLFIIVKKSDSSILSPYKKQIIHLYSQGIYSFYKAK